MSKISFTNLKLKVNNNTKKFKINNIEIEVYQYIPIEDKYDFVLIVLQKATEGSIINSVKEYMYFLLYLTYLYTNISFTEKQREDEEKLFNILQTNGIFKQVINNMREEEFDELITLYTRAKHSVVADSRSTIKFLQALITDLPKNAEAAANIVENFDQDKYANIIQFARAANGGRDIKTNEPIEKG